MFSGKGLWPWNEEAKPVEIDCKRIVYSVAFLPDGEHFLSGDEGETIRRWRTADGQEVLEEGMDAKSFVYDLAVSADGKLLVSGTKDGMLRVWNPQNHEKVSEFQGHRRGVRAVDVSADGTRIASGLDDNTLRVWSLSGEQLLGPLEHDNWVAAVKFSPDGRLIATATFLNKLVRVYDSLDGRPLFDFPVQVNSRYNQSVVWTSDSQRLFVLSSDGQIHGLDASEGKTLSKWRIHNTDYPACIALGANDAFIAASSGSSVSFWDPATQKQIGSVVNHTEGVRTMAISVKHDIVLGGGNKVTFRTLRNILPSGYTKNLHGPRLRNEKNRVGDSSSSLEEEKDISASDNRHESSSRKIARLEKTVHDLQHELAVSQRTVRELRREIEDNTQLLCAHEKRHRCEALYIAGRVYDSALCLVEITSAISEAVKNNQAFTDWITEFTIRCSSTLERMGDDASHAKKHDEALASYALVLYLGPNIPKNVLTKWATIVMTQAQGSVDRALGTTAELPLPMFSVYQSICDILERDGRVMDAITCFKRMQRDLVADMSGERLDWERSFQHRCAQRLEELADVARDAQEYDEVIEHLSAALSLEWVGDRTDLLVKRSDAHAQVESWEEALSDAYEAIKLDPSSHRGYERQLAALHGVGRHSEAVEAFDMMLSNIDQSPDENIRNLRSRYTDARPVIRRIVLRTIRHMPVILIDTATGRLCDKNQQAAAFEALPIWSELVSSMTRELDYARIGIAVKEFYRYVMLSHTWEEEEPLLQKVKHTSVYQLQSSPTNHKLREFCSIVNTLGFKWAWADTTCIDQKDNVVLQESLVAMFTWYRGSSLTLIYLRDVSSESDVPDGLRRSRWNTRGWTYQEYVAAETVLFYTGDWKPYLGLTLQNHKDSPEIISEMQHAIGMSVNDMVVLEPGLDRVREKLFVASMRQTTRTEDMAYSLLGIFNIAIPVIYGEGDRAVGRLLEHILTGSGDISILAWTGRAGSYNSSLPVDLTVYHELVPPHIPQPIDADDMAVMVTELRSSLPDLSGAVKLYNELKAIPPPFFAASRLRLAGIVCRITELIPISSPDAFPDLNVYHATTALFGNVEIRTMAKLGGAQSLRLIHPWIRPLLQQEFQQHADELDADTQALRFLARVRQPFGALLLERVSLDGFKRVAADGLIVVRIREEVELDMLVESVDTIDIQ